MTFDWQFDNGLTFALLPVRCIDGTLAWFRWVYYADVNHGIYFNPYTVTRFYSTTPGYHSIPAAPGGNNG